MSHFGVAVLQTPTSPDIYEMLAPYDEDLEVEPYVNQTKAEALAYCRQRIADAARRAEEGGGQYDSFDPLFLAHADDDDEPLHEWYAKEFCNAETDEEGNILTTYNPQSKYDYYSEIETLGFYEWLASGAKESDEELRHQWEIFSTRGDGFFTKQYYTDRYGSEDIFIKAQRLPQGWAVVTPDGEWHEPGRVIWFGMDTSTAESYADWVDHFDERFVKPYEDETVTVVMLDCHI